MNVNFCFTLFSTAGSVQPSLKLAKHSAAQEMLRELAAKGKLILNTSDSVRL